jgi:phosphatidylinositol alpha-1,6-mannosyltransferase
VTRLIFTPGFPPIVGGLPNYMFARCMAAPDDIEVLATRCPGDEAFDAQLPFPVLRFVLYKPPVTPWLDPVYRGTAILRTARVLHRFLRTGRYAVVETATVFPGAVAAQLLPSLRGVRLISHALGDDVRRPLSTPWAAPLFRLALRRVDRFVAISRYTRGLLLEAGVEPDRVVVVRPPLDVAKFQQAGDGASWRAGWPPHSHVLLTLCRLAIKKGVDRVIEVLPQLLQETPGLLYVVAGEGPDRARLEALATQAGVRERVYFAGRIATERLADLYAAADVFVMPTRVGDDGSVEGFGIVFLEAGSQGVPVVGPRLGGSEDAIAHGETGFLVDADDPEDIARRLLELLRDPDLRRTMGAAGKRRAFESTDWSPALA